MRPLWINPFYVLPSDIVEGDSDILQAEIVECDHTDEHCGQREQLLHDVDVQVQLRKGYLSREVARGLPEDVAGEDRDKALVPCHEQGRLLQRAAQERLVDED